MTRPSCSLRLSKSERLELESLRASGREGRALARKLGIELRWLPTATPELNPLENLWGELKDSILANEPEPNVQEAAERAVGWLQSLPPKELLHKAGVFSPNFWLRDVPSPP